MRLDGMAILSHEDTWLQNVSNEKFNLARSQKKKKGLGCMADRAFLQYVTSFFLYTNNNKCTQ